MHMLLILILESSSVALSLSLVNNNSINNRNPIHTLLLCRHGDSIWNGGQPGGTKETFTGWTDVELSQKGTQEAYNTGKQISSYNQGIDACFTSILTRATLTAHHCTWAFSEQPFYTHPRKYVSDYRLNERHYGALQGLVKMDVESGIYGHDPKLVKQWRRNWYAVPPLLDHDDPRRIQEIQKYANFCNGEENVPRGESLEMVANDRIRPFLDQVLHPIMEEAAERKYIHCRQSNDKTTTDGCHIGGTGLVIAHANSLRALIGVICQVENDQKALEKLEAMKILTGVPLIMKYQKNEDGGTYHAHDITKDLDNHWDSQNMKNISPDLPVWPLSCIPKRKFQLSPSSTVTTSSTTDDQELRNENKYGARRKTNAKIRIDVI